jgi:heat shock protein HslJ
MPRRHVRAVVVSGVIACLELTGCDSTSGRSADAALARTPELVDLTDGVWVADGIDDPNREIVPGSSIRLTFTDDSLSVDAGCNIMGGPASIDGDELVVGDLAGTLIACEEPLAQQEQWLSTLLTSGPEIESHEADLWLSHDDSVIHFVNEDA